MRPCRKHDWCWQLLSFEKWRAVCPWQWAGGQDWRSQVVTRLFGVVKCLWCAWCWRGAMGTPVLRGVMMELERGALWHSCRMYWVHPLTQQMFLERRLCQGPCRGGQRRTTSAEGATPRGRPMNRTTGGKKRDRKGSPEPSLL